MLSMANLFYRDVGFLFRSLIQLWMFVTCVVYQLEPADPWKRAIVQLNPMTPIINAHRDCLLRGRNPLTPDFITAAVVSLLVLVIGWSWFTRREFEFAERA
jgi:lipopolysaccharide transport system permease protein